MSVFDVGVADGIEKTALSPETVGRAVRKRGERVVAATEAAENSARATGADMGLRRLALDTAKRELDKGRRMAARSQSWQTGAKQRAVKALARGRGRRLLGLAGAGLLTAGGIGAAYSLSKDRETV